MSETRFADLGKVEAISTLYKGTSFKPFQGAGFTTSGQSVIKTASRMLLEDIDFDLVYFPFKHLGYKSVIEVTGELYSQLAHPKTLSVVLGISAKLDFAEVSEIWSGIVTAAKEHGFTKVDLDLMPSRNGLSISISATGETSLLTSKRKSAPKTKDLICVSGSLGAAYLGFKVLEKEKAAFDSHVSEHTLLDMYKMQVGAYLKPELGSGTVAALEDAEIYPSCGYFVTSGLADTVKRLVRDTGLGAKIYADKIPFEGNSFQLGKELNIDPISAAMNGGDDCKLLFTVPILYLEKFRRDFQTFDIIGHLSQSEVGAALVLPDGLEMPIRAQGWKDDEE